MTVNAVLEASGEVSCSHLADGRLVRLAGDLGPAQLDRLRLTLLMPLPEGCRDVVVDAGEVTAVSDDVLAVLLAAPLWARDEGRRFLLSRTSTALDDLLDELDLTGDLPRLQPLGAPASSRPAPALVPAPRTAVD